MSGASRRIGRVQADRASASRLQTDGRNSEAVCGRRLQSLLHIEDRREDQLEVGRVALAARTHERRRLPHVRRQHAAPAKHEPQQLLRRLGGVERFLAARVEEADRHAVVLKSLPDVREIRLHRHADLPQMLGGPDPGRHQDLRRADRARAQDHLSVRTHAALLIPAPVAHTGGTATLERDAGHLAVGQHGEVPAALGRLQVVVGGAAAQPAALGDPDEARALQ